MSSVNDWFGFGSEETDCLNKANASPQVAQIDSHINLLLTTWHPTGYYLPDEIQRAFDTLTNAAAEAGAVLGAAPDSTSDAAMVKAQAFEDAKRKIYDQGNAYLNAIAGASASGSDAIDAPGLKDWVIQSMRAISDVYVTAAVLQCRQTWLESILDHAYQAIMAVFTVVSQIVGVAVDLVKQAYKATELAIGLTAWLVKYGPYIAGGLGLLVAAWFAREAWSKHGHLITHGLSDEHQHEPIDV